MDQNGNLITLQAQTISIKDAADRLLAVDNTSRDRSVNQSINGRRGTAKFRSDRGKEAAANNTRCRRWR